MRFFVGLLMAVWGQLFLAQVSAAQERGTIAPTGETRLDAVIHKKAAAVTIRTLQRENAQASGDPGGRTRTIVQALLIAVDGAQILVPRSAFADLIDPREARVEAKQGKFVLSITGGDGAESYLLHLHFDGTRIFRRALYSPLIPDKAVEETRYWLRVLKDE